MTYENIAISIEKGVCTLTLNRPEKRNAFSNGMRIELEHFFKEANANDDVRVIILTGTGPVFCAGGDLNTLQKVDVITGRKRILEGQELLQKMLNIEKPIIAALNGAAAGAGVSIALACDIIIAGRSAKLIQSFVKVGLVPDLGALYLLTALIGRHRALEMMLLGEAVSAHEGKELGIINRVVEDEQLMAEAKEVAVQLVQGPKTAIGFIKKLINRSTLTNLYDSLELEAFAQGVCFESEDFQEGVKAFFEKRKPQFK